MPIYLADDANSVPDAKLFVQAFLLDTVTINFFLTVNYSTTNE